jgi:predicted O-methyltransferase YrrM
LKPYTIAKFIWYFIKHYLRSGNEHSIHSPFVFKFYSHVIKTARKKDRRFAAIVQLTNQLLKNNTQIEYTDPSSKQSKKQTIGFITKTAAKPARIGRVLGLSVNYFKPNKALELGTSLGISALYQTAIFEPTLFISVDANEQLNKIAAHNLNIGGCKTIKLKLGFFNEVLTELEDLDKMEWVFIDGDHQLRPTLFYFKYLIERLPDNAVIVFDDINWSADMQQAWRQIIKHKRVTIALDFFFLGFVFINPKYTKQTFKLRL